MKRSEEFEYAFKSVVSTPVGRQFIYLLMEDLGFTQSSFVSSCQNSTSYQEGLRGAALMLYEWFKTDRFTLLCYGDMLRENLIEKQNEEEKDDEQAV